MWCESNDTEAFAAEAASEEADRAEDTEADFGF